MNIPILRKPLFVVSFLVLASEILALSLNGLFTDNMVLQREKAVPVWGSAAPGSTVEVSFAGQTLRAKTAADGEWTVELSPLEASSKPQILNVVELGTEERISRNNILVGDVWLCTGQSNMAWTMDRFLFWDSIKDAFSNDQIRMFKIKEGGVGSPQPSKEIVVDKDFQNSWQLCTPEFAQHFSATAGFFGMKLQPAVDVPIGLLYANRGGTAVNMWLPREVMEAKEIYADYLDPSNLN
ncbi:MAG: hypothetical protein ACPGN3_03400 [Opitutales bacterium]